MTDQNQPPEPPEGLGERGSSFWRELFADIDWDMKETVLLAEACRTLDQIDALAAAIDTDGLTVSGSMGQTVIHPAVAELRQHQAAFARLISAVNFPDDEANADRFNHKRAKAAAAARWDRPQSPMRGQLRAVKRG